MTVASSAPKSIGASSATKDGAEGATSTSTSLLLGRGGGAVAEVRVRQAREQPLDVGRGGDGRADLVAGHDRDVVLGEHVRGVGHRDHQRALVRERDRHRLVAADGAAA